jgi:hypothetical protein
MYPESRPGEFYLVDTECINGGVPYSENFYVVNRYCISRLSSSKSRLLVTSQIKYRKSVWGFVRNLLDKNVTAGIQDAFSSLAEVLRQESNRHGTGRKRPRRRLGSKQPAPADSAAHEAADHVAPTAGAKRTSTAVADTDSTAGAKSKLTSDSYGHLIFIALLVLVALNFVLLFKLSSLESRYSVAKFSVPHHQYSDLVNTLHVNDENPRRWMSSLDRAIHLLDELADTLADLRTEVAVSDHMYSQNANNPAGGP